MKRIGFYGGSFNPPTKAHIELAKKAIEECNLDEIIFMPVSDLYKKEGMAEGIHRYNMLQIACRKEESLQVSDIEIKTNKDYRAIEIFEILEKQYVQSENFFLMGSDNLEKILSWKEGNRLVSDFNYIILDRGIRGTKDIIEANNILKINKDRFMVVSNKEYNDCSSTYIRKQLQSGEKPKNLDDEVYNYIRENNIYCMKVL